MRRVAPAALAGAAAACLVLASAAVARGARGPSGAAVPHGGSPVGSRTEGRVQSVDPSDRTLTLVGGGKKLKVGPSTLIVKDGTATSFEDIAAGDEVRASFLADDPSYLLRLDVTSGSRATPAPASPLPSR